MKVFSHASAFPALAMLLLVGKQRMLRSRRARGDAVMASKLESSSSSGYEDLGPTLPCSLSRGARIVPVDAGGSWELWETDVVLELGGGSSGRKLSKIHDYSFPYPP